MGLFSFLSSSKETPALAFEKQLAELEIKIEQHQLRLQSIRERERSTRSSVTRYSLGFWVLYSGLWYCGWGVTRWTARGSEESSDGAATLNNVLEASPIVFIPIGLLFVRQVFQTWFERKQESEQLQLRNLQKQLREKVEDLKKQTSYYSTRELLERYDDKLKKSNGNQLPPGPNRSQPIPPMTTPSAQMLKHRGSPSTFTPPTNPSGVTTARPSPHGQPGGPSLPAPHPYGALEPSPTGTRGWADRFAEVLLGDDEARPESKYALICVKCLAHNGLVRKEELDHIQYLCPRCGTFNPAKIRRSRAPDRPSSRTSSNQRNGEHDDQRSRASGSNCSRSDSGSDSDARRPFPSGRAYGSQGRKSLGVGLGRRPSSSSLQGTDKKRAVSLAAQAGVRRDHHINHHQHMVVEEDEELDVRNSPSDHE